MGAIHGSKHDEELIGTNGHDVIIGFGGDDTLYGRDGNDVLTGNKGSDDLFGGSGHDTLYGGTGNDFLTGGKGGDSFVFQADSGRDVISDYKIGTDGLIFVGGEISYDDLEIVGYSNATTDVTVIKWQSSDPGSVQLNSITLLGVSSEDLSRDEFSFVV